MENNNRRQFTRVPFKVPIKMQANGKIYKAARTYNLAIGGCLLEVGYDLPKETPCEIKFLLSQIDEEVNIHVDGRIVRTEEGMVAVKFTGIEPDDLFHLRNIIRYNALDSDLVETEIEKHPGVL